MTLLILFTTIIPFLFLKEISYGFETLKPRRGLTLGVLFVTGVSFYATGNGVHEVSSFNFNYFCSPESYLEDFCSGFFFNDYYTGNIYYFVGAALMTASLFFLERLSPNKIYRRKDLPMMLINAVIYAFAIFAYAAFDEVLIGLVYSLIIMILAEILLFLARKRYLEHPFITYSAVTYTLGTLAALVMRFH